MEPCFSCVGSPFFMPSFHSRISNSNVLDFLQHYPSLCIKECEVLFRNKEFLGTSLENILCLPKWMLSLLHPNFYIQIDQKHDDASSQCEK